MQLNELASTRTIKRGFLSLALAAGLAGGLGAVVAWADGPGTPVPSRAVAVDSTTMRVVYTNTADECNEGNADASTCVYFMMRYRLQSSVPDVESSYTYIGGGAPTDDNVYYNSPLPPFLPLGFEVGYAVHGLAPSTAYCFSLRSWTPDGGYSPWSGDVCGQTKATSPTPAQGPSSTVLVPVSEGTETTPVNAGSASTSSVASRLAQTDILPHVATSSKPDLDAVQIAGFTTVSNGDNDVYSATLRNDGAAANGSVEVVIGMSGALQAWDAIVQSIGLSCTQGTGQNVNTFTCEGGTLAAGQSATLSFRAHAANPGQGTIVVSLNPSRALDESNYANNLAIYTVTVTK
jgi:CARDB